MNIKEEIKFIEKSLQSLLETQKYLLSKNRLNLVKSCNNMIKHYTNVLAALKSLDILKRHMVRIGSNNQLKLEHLEYYVFINSDIDENEYDTLYGVLSN